VSKWTEWSIRWGFLRQAGCSIPRAIVEFFKWSLRPDRMETYRSQQSDTKYFWFEIEP
jgi:hypothetical protein